MSAAQVNFGEEIDQLANAGWSTERAIACVLLFAVRQSMARALRERDPCFAASTCEQKKSSLSACIPAVAPSSSLTRLM